MIFFLPRKNLIIFLCLLTIAIGLEFLPAVKEGRYAVPAEVFKKTGSCDCNCISNARPLYSTINYWYWLFFLTPPLLIFSLRRTAPIMYKALVAMIAVGFCTAFIALGIELRWDIRNGPFYGLDASLTNGKLCADTSDGASLVFGRYFGWIPASLYVGFWLLIRWVYNKCKANNS